MKIKLIYYFKRLIKQYLLSKKIKKDNNKNTCYILMAASYGNMGDVAITVSQAEFLNKNLDNYSIKIIDLGQLYYYARDIKRNYKKGDLITIIGGGNTGDLYLNFEYERRFIIKYFKNYKIIAFPQTIDFNNKNEEEKSIKIYNSNNNFYFFVREKLTFDKYKDKIKKIYLCPDIVLSQKKYIEKKVNTITLCLRNDKELINKNYFNKLRVEIQKKYNNIREMDTSFNEEILKNNSRIKIFNNFINDFGKSKIVITNRLHGMIFCVISKTPCIVFDNSNHKIKSTYETWLKNIGYIHFLDYDENSITEIFNILSMSNSKINKSNFDGKFSELKAILKHEVNNE